MKKAPGIKRQFFDALKRGTGGAYVIAQENPAIDFSWYVIQGVLHNYAYDGQAEPSRAQYILDLIALSSKKKEIRAALLKGIETVTDDTWSLTHLFDLAKLFAQDGDEEARKAIYDRFGNNPIEGSDWIGYEEILALDGREGLLFIANKLGRSLELNSDGWQDDSIIRHFQDQNPKINAMQTLEESAKQDRYVRVYLDAIQKTNAKRVRHQRPIYNFQSLIEQIDSGKRMFAPPTLFESLSSDEIFLLADKFMQETDDRKKEEDLHVFTRLPFPYHYSILLEFALRRSTSTNRLRDFAIDALEHISAPEVRAFALQKLQTTRSPGTFTRLLISNYHAGDAKLLTSIVEKYKNEHIIEDLACSYVDIYAANRTKECEEPLVALYKKMNCGIHRNAALEILIANDDAHAKSRQ